MKEGNEESKVGRKEQRKEEQDNIKALTYS
jgi:hypothetical protein